MDSEKKLALLRRLSELKKEHPLDTLDLTTDIGTAAESLLLNFPGEKVVYVRCPLDGHYRVRTIEEIFENGVLEGKWTWFLSTKWAGRVSEFLEDSPKEYRKMLWLDSNSNVRYGTYPLAAKDDTEVIVEEVGCDDFLTEEEESDLHVVRRQEARVLGC